MESLALTVEEVVDVRRVLVKAEMEKFVQDKELFSSLKRGKVRCLESFFHHPELGYRNVGQARVSGACSQVW